MADPLVSIIIVNWNVRDLLRSCLKSVETSIRRPREAYEVIVVDNDSADDSVAMLREEFPQVRLIESKKNLGFGGGNNLAARESKAPFWILLNPDTVVRGNALDEMLDFIQSHPEVVAVGSRLLNPDGSLQRWTGGSFPTVWTTICHYLFLNRVLPRFLRPASLYLDQDAKAPTEVDWVSGACLLLRREGVGSTLFDERFFMYGEDMELCYRLKKAGGKIVYLPAAEITHYHGASMKQQSGEVLYQSLQGLRSFYAMTRGRGALWLVDLATILGFGLRFILYSIASWVRPRGEDAAKAASSRHYLGLATKLFLGGGRKRPA